MQSSLFKVVSISENTNSFGLTGMILMDSRGETWEVGANYLNIKKKGDIIRIDNTFGFAGSGFEIPRRLPNAPQNVINEIW